MIGLDDLQGVWRLTRQIEDRRAGLVGEFEGEARFLRDDAGLRQEEEGVLRYGTATPMQANRVYLWREDASGLAVFFDDGRPFHRLGEGQLDDIHHCDPDIYRVQYDFSDWPVWRQVWDVTGPRKDMTLRSKFSRG